MQDEEPPLGAGPSDHVSAVIRMGVGAVPVVGSALNELVNQIIPGIRMQRIEKYLRFLRHELRELDEEQLRQKTSSDLAVDVFEEGAFQSARALTEERREQIASAVAKGLSGDQLSLLQAKRMLQLLRELDDVQVIVLSSNLMKNHRDDEFMKRHADVLRVTPALLGAGRDALDQSVVQSIVRAKLISLALLRPRFMKPKKGDTPEFDENTGMVKSSGVEITPLGKLLLRQIGLASEEDY